MGKLSGKVAVVTGASSGNGRAIALCLAVEGSHVACGDLSPNVKHLGPEDDLSPTHELIQRNGGKALYLKTDAGESEDMQNLIRFAVEEFGRVDIMINNAGIGIDTAGVHNTSEETFDRTIKVNLRSCFLGMKYAIRQMISQEPHSSGDRGWVVNLSSISGLTGMPEAPSYGASKAGVELLTKSSAIDYAKDRIHVNSICPGYINTSLVADPLSNPDFKKHVENAHPWPRIGSVHDVAKAALFLVSDESAWITGSHLVLDGGFTARGALTMGGSIWSK
ncbi:putative gluconate 5-dehydrogenase [Viridothelium virens]|uniref:Putative gluconate 5-dehydrogenase n=1 Tax=Viridothelium virens TaxID=1048519 RepID=A0A6A6H3C4_VIRVR|nr:putative gluconate 5-dehydrogenase [Viridothelium virens]